MYHVAEGISFSPLHKSLFGQLKLRKVIKLSFYLVGVLYSI